MAEDRPRNWEFAIGGVVFALLALTAIWGLMHPEGVPVGVWLSTLYIAVLMLVTLIASYYDREYNKTRKDGEKAREYGWTILKVGMGVAFGLALLFWGNHWYQSQHKHPWPSGSRRST